MPLYNNLILNVFLKSMLSGQELVGLQFGTENIREIL